MADFRPAVRRCNKQTRGENGKQTNEGYEMGNENGTWIMRGVPESDPRCIRSPEELIAYIDRVGFLPLFKNGIDGFSVEEHTAPGGWWSGDVRRDPWEWRAVIAQSGKAAYGKFFDGKAGFVSLAWLPYFVNCRRDGYDFDARWDDEKASLRQKKIMDIFLSDGAEEAELFSFDLKERAGYGKGGEKNFEGIVTGLQMQTYLCVRDFRQKTNKKGEPYGWSVAVYCTPEHIWGADTVCAAYAESPETSRGRIAALLTELYPAPSRIEKVL